MAVRWRKLGTALLHLGAESLVPLVFVVLTAVLCCYAVKGIWSQHDQNQRTKDELNWPNAEWREEWNRQRALDAEIRGREMKQRGYATQGP